MACPLGRRAVLGAQLSGSSSSVRQEGDPGGGSCHGGNSEPFPWPRRKLQMLLIEPSPPPSSSLWESAVGQVPK